MPRGSRPGERRGGRQRGTPNKKTLLKNAVFLAAAGGTAAEPNRSPLEFMLALMRDSQVPLDDRIELAAKAAPFVHARPAPVQNKRADPLDLRDRLGDTGDLRFGKVEAKPDAAKPAANGGGGEGGCEGGGLSPLDFLLGVMSDPAADPEQRVKAAAIAARYKHPHAGSEAPTVSVVEDKFGFKVNPELACAERDDRLREATLRATAYTRKKGAEKLAEEELEQIGKRRAERVALLRFPDGYAYADRQNDESRLAQLYSKRLSRKKLTPEEDAEEAHLAVRVLHPQAKPPAIACILGDEYKMEWPMTRMVELEERVAGGETLTIAEADELKDLRDRHPEIAADVDRLDHQYNYCVRREWKKAERAGMHSLKAYQTAKDKCKTLKNPRKMVDLREIREGPQTRIHELETLRFDKILTSEEADELAELHRLYPQRAEEIRNSVDRKLSEHQANRDYRRRTGSDPGPIEEDGWPRRRTPTGRMAGR